VANCRAGDEANLGLSISRPMTSGGRDRHGKAITILDIATWVKAV
jgi:hypothetical protein